MDNQPTIHRHRGHAASHDPSLKGGEPVKNALWGGIAAALLLGALMFGAFGLAQRYLQRDWSDRVAAAREAGRGRGGASGGALSPGNGRALCRLAPPSRWLAHWGPAGAAMAAAERGAAGPDGARNAWLVLGCASRGASAERAFLLAEASGCAPERVDSERGRQALRERRPGDALAAFRRALAAKPGWPPALLGEAVAASRLRQRDLALSALAAYLPSNPHHAGSLRLAAYLLDDMKRPAEGLALLERELAAGGDPSLFLDAAQLAARARKPHDAVAYLETALDRNLPLPEIASLFKSPLFDGFRATPEGKAFSHRLAAAARAQLETPTPTAAP